MNAWQITDPVLVFAAIMLIMLAAPILFSRLRAPGLIGLIVAGMLTGPHALGIFALDSTFELLGKVGLLYLMFLAGLEIEFDEFARHRFRSLVFGFFTFILPQGLGMLGARQFFGFSWPTSILLASMFASHTLIPFPIVGRLGLTRNRAVATAVGGTILTDTAALLVLAVIAESANATLSGWFWARQGVLLSLLILFGLWLLPRIGYWFFRVAAPDETSEFLFIVAAVFVTSYLAALCGVEPILGAFLAGLSLNRLVPSSSPLMNRLEFVGNALFIPFFLISVGMRVDLRVALLQARSWAISAYMVAAVIATKWLAAQIGGGLLRFSRDERGILFGLSVNQAAATLAAVLVGQRIGLFDETILNGTILMILATCLLGPWVTQRHGERLARAAPSARDAGPAPTRVMVPLSHPETAPALMDVALALRGRNAAAPVYPVTIVQDGVDVEARVEEGEKTLGKAIAHAAAAGAPVYPVTNIDVSIGGGIVRALREYRISTVVMGWSLRYGSPASRVHWLPQFVLEESRALMALARVRRPLGSYRRAFLVAPPLVEKTPGFAEALRAALILGGLCEIHLFTPPDAAKSLAVAVARAKPGGAPALHPVADWDRLIPEALASVRPAAQDLFLLLLARRGCLGWQPRAERWPGQIAEQYPEADFVILHPPLPAAEAADAGEIAPTPVEEPLVAETRIRIGLDGRWSEVIEALLSAAPEANEPEATERRARFPEREPIALAPGVLLLHGHEPGLAAPIAFIAAARGEGIRPPPPAEAARALLILLSPADQPPAVHLRALAELARAARHPAFRAALESAAEPRALAEAFRAATRAPRV